MLSTNIQVPKICDNENQVKKILLYRGSVIFVHCIQGTLANPHLEPCRPPQLATVQSGTVLMSAVFSPSLATHH